MNDGKTYAERSLVCPVCGKRFVPAPYHVFKEHRTSARLVCSWTCARRSYNERRAIGRAAGARRAKAHIRIHTPVG